MEDIIKVRNMSKIFSSGSKVKVKAVNNVSLNVAKNETYSLVGESGCGKSTTGRCILRLTEPTEGNVYFHDEDILKYSGSEMKKIRPKMQMIFQDPFTSLNRRMPAGKIVEEALLINRVGSSTKERTEIAMSVMEKVGLRRDQYYRLPHEFSGGQRQRIGLARAIVLNPELIICDEPVSALDVSIQSQVLNLIKKLQQDLEISYLFISHNMSVVRYVSDRIGVMYLGTIVEEAPTDELFSNPLHPYTKALLSAIPVANPFAKMNRILLHGDIPSPIHMPSGCPFHSRCEFAKEECYEKLPDEVCSGDGHKVRCILYSK